MQDHNIREQDLNALIEWDAISNDLALKAFLELKQRRAEDRQREFDNGSNNA